jgi:uncharacterized protein
MRIIKWSELQAAPWKNAGGITREIARETTGNGFAWRLSLADVEMEGPFSRFDGMRRILTVVEGKGMELQYRDGVLIAELGVPVEFDGSLDITSRLKDGPLRDLNLIFDPQSHSGHVRQVKSGETQTLQRGKGQTLAIYCIGGEVDLGQSQTLQRGDTAFLDEVRHNVRCEAGSQALLVDITRKY